MSAEQTTYAALSAYMGSPSPVADRIYPDVIPQDVDIPAIAYRRSATDPVMGLNGFKNAARVQITIESWGRTRAEAELIANAVQSAMLQDNHVPGEREGVYDEDTRTFAVLQGFDVWEV